MTAGVPQGCASRFTHSEHSLSKVTAGKLAKGCMTRCLPRGGKTVIQYVASTQANPEELGAHAADMQSSHASRVGKVQSRLSDPKQTKILPMLKATTKPIMTIEYALLEAAL